ncbi:uncharacterized protein DFL_002855 [Arthrobotrys flagrans]|uniref:Uncharacterized protein n=1 Tax=Arthrobotrys flagrans TaxID=97331 RepID=A0A437ABP6_ARTFL|nr:hypothetical protein DFL_002855 [Arthrobotrys flagrans]
MEPTTKVEPTVASPGSMDTEERIKELKRSLDTILRTLEEIRLENAQHTATLESASYAGDYACLCRAPDIFEGKPNTIQTFLYQRFGQRLVDASRGKTNQSGGKWQTRKYPHRIVDMAQISRIHAQPLGINNEKEKAVKPVPAETTCAFGITERGKKPEGPVTVPPEEGWYSKNTRPKEHEL